MDKRISKYIASAGITLMFLSMILASLPASGIENADIFALFPNQKDSTKIRPAATEPADDPVRYRQPESPFDSNTPPPTQGVSNVLPGHENPYRYVVPDGETTTNTTISEYNLPPDRPVLEDTTKMDIPADSTRRDSIRHKNFLDDIISGKNRDSLVYDVKNGLVYIYSEGDVSYQNMNMKADYMRITMETKELYAHGVADTLGNVTRPEFMEGNSLYTMDTINYNISTEKAKIKGVATQEGEGFLLGQNVKKHHDNSIHIKDGKYTTCDDPDCPHFYLAMTKAKVLPNEKVIIGPSYIVMEDVPLYFLFLPEGFFPLVSGQKSGVILPTFGEEYVKGFFMRDGGYYFVMSEHMDLTLLGGIYTKGSWEASASSRYTKRYKHNGSFSLRFSKDVRGERGDNDYLNQNNFRIAWTHTQDPKFRPNSQFSASVNFSTSGYSKNSSTTMQDYLNTQTNSSISYSKSWPGTPFSFSTSLTHSQNSANQTYTLGFPNARLNMSRIHPFKRKNAVGKQRWYEKISMTYSGDLKNSVTVKEDDLFQEKMFKDMNPTMTHNIPLSASFNLFNYINLTPSASYSEVWSVRKIAKEWDDDLNQQIVADTTYGFHRVYNYNASMSASTKIYGTYLFKSKTSFVQAIRHTITPSVGVSYRPDFSKAKYGFYEPIQSDSTGNWTTYSPYHGAPGSGRNASLTFSLSQTLEAKVLSKADTSGVKKVKIIDNFSFSGSYNFLAESFKLSKINLSLRATLPFLKNFGLNLSAVLDPYEVENVNGRAVRVDRLMMTRKQNWKLGRIESTGWSAGYTFNGGKGKGGNAGQVAVNNINTHIPGMNDMSMLNPWYYDPDNPIDPAFRREMMVSTYYDFSIPWNFGFNYSVSYRNDGVKKNVTQSLSFQGSVNLTPKWGISFTGGYDFVNKELTPGTFTLSRDLHCWQFNFNWVPIGYRKSWSFNISVKSPMLRDLKYDRSSSHYDNLYDN